MPKSSEWVLDRNKFFEKNQVADIEIALEEIKEAFWHSNGATVGVTDPYDNSFFRRSRISLARDWFVVKLGLNTGLRVLEMSKLKCGDFNINSQSPSVNVRCGKGCKQRRVRFSENFKKDVLEYFEMKKTMGQKIKPVYPLFFSKYKGEVTTRALQKSFKRVAERAGLNECYSIHCLRHTYASFLYKASNHNLRLVQLQLGHSSIQITQIYTHLIDSDAEKSFDRIYEKIEV